MSPIMTRPILATVHRQISNFQSASSDFLKPHDFPNLGSLDVSTLMQAGQQACFARTLDSLSIDVHCISETRIQDSSSDSANCT